MSSRDPGQRFCPNCGLDQLSCFCAGACDPPSASEFACCLALWIGLILVILLAGRSAGAL